MTTLYKAHRAPGTHVLAIGVGKYPHLIEGAGPLAKNTLGLGQLTSPPVSVKAFVDWCLAPILKPGAAGFHNPLVPLASLEALASSEAATTVATPGSTVELKAATRSNIQHAFERWLNRVACNENNIGVFYFCGHGIMVADHYLLAEDFGESDRLPWDKAFDVSNTLRAVERDVKGALYFFIDACRKISIDVALTLGANPHTLEAIDSRRPVICTSSSLIRATGEGELAFGLGGKVSRFTQALLTAMSGYCGVQDAGPPTWYVDGEALASAVRKLLENGNKTPSRRQVSSQDISGSSVPLLRLATAPQMKVEIDLSPEEKRSRARMYVLSGKGRRFDHDGAKGVFQIEVPRGFYSVGARAAAREFADIHYEDQDLTPPLFDLTMQAQ